jgi:DNA-binding transcriptional MerR regulator
VDSSATGDGRDVLIGEVARRSGVSIRMLRHYDALGLVSPTGRTSGGYREYSPEDVRRVFQVESLRSLGLSLSQVGSALADPATTPSTVVGDLIRWTQDRLDRERELLERLRSIEASTSTGWEGVLRVVELLQGLASTSAPRRQQAALDRTEGTPVSADVLAGAVLTEPDPHVAGALRWALARADGDGLPALAAGVRAADVAVRRRAVLALGETSDARADAALTDALADPDTMVRAHAALALGRRGREDAVPALVDLVAGGAYDVEAAEVLGALSGDPGCADRVLDTLAHELDSPTADTASRLRLTQALVELPGATVQELLRRLTDDGDQTVALVASALVRVHERRTRPSPSDHRGPSATS